MNTNEALNEGKLLEGKSLKLSRPTFALNCDMGEGLDTIDEAIMPCIDMANIACGYHAGDLETMFKTVALAKKYHVKVGVHPSFKDKENFGRKEQHWSKEEIKALIHAQCHALEEVCLAHELTLSYVKPHGALYNMMMKDFTLFQAICEALAAYDSNLKLMILSNQNNDTFADIAKDHGIALLYEVFADRHYTDEGHLVARSEASALLDKKEDVLKRAKTLLSEGYIESINGKPIRLKVDTLCVHSDTTGALTLIKSLKMLLRERHAS